MDRIPLDARPEQQAFIIGGPLRADAETTCPVISIRTCTVTIPLALADRTAFGYLGWGTFIARSLRRPPTIVLGVGSPNGCASISLLSLFCACVLTCGGVELIEFGFVPFVHALIKNGTTIKECNLTMQEPLSFDAHPRPSDLLDCRTIFAGNQPLRLRTLSQER